MPDTHKWIEDAAKKCAMYASGMPEGSEFVRVFASIIRTALAARDAQVLAALRAAKLVQGTYHDGCPLEELFSTIDGLAAALSAQLVAAMLANRNAAASDAGTGQDTPTG